MQRAIEKFRLNIKSVKDLDSLYTLLTKNYPLLEEQSSDILRAEVVLAVSALDCFIHDLVKQGMVEAYQEIRIPSTSFENYQIPFKSLKLIENSDNLEGKLVYLEKAIQDINSKDSYQSPKSIEYALQFINVSKIWQKVFVLMPPLKAEDIKNELSLIINRRNKIAHEADYDTLGFKAPIEQQNINDIVQFIEKLCESIYQVAQNTTT